MILKPNSDSGIDISFISKDVDLNTIRGIPRFKILLEKYFKKEDLDKFPDMYKQVH